MLSLRNTIKLTSCLCPCNQASQSIIMVCSRPQKPQSTNGTVACRDLLCVLCIPSDFIQHSLTSRPPWLCPSVQMANGQRASRRLSLPMSYSWAGGRRNAPRHTPCQKHTQPCAPVPLTTLPLQTSSYPLKPLWHFHFMCHCTPILPS